MFCSIIKIQYVECFDMDSRCYFSAIFPEHVHGSDFSSLCFNNSNVYEKYFEASILKSDLQFPLKVGEFYICHWIIDKSTLKSVNKGIEIKSIVKLTTPTFEFSF